MTRPLRRRLWVLLSGRGSIGRYGVIGITGVGIDVVVFTILVGLGMIPVLATVIGTLAGITNNYTWNSLLNFQMKLSGSRGSKFLTVGVVGLGASAALLQLFIEMGFEPLTAKWLSIPLVVGGQFLANKFWTFKNHAVA